MKPEEFDKIYRKELEQLISLKSIIISRFPDFYDSILKIDGYHNNYWGNQRILLHVDYNENKEDFRVIQTKIIEIANETNREINELNRQLRKYSETISICTPPNNKLPAI